MNVWTKLILTCWFVAVFVAVVAHAWWLAWLYFLIACIYWRLAFLQRENDDLKRRGSAS